MKKNNIKKAALTLATIQALSLSACKNKNVETIDFPTNEVTISERIDSIIGSHRTYRPVDAILNQFEYTDIVTGNIKDINSSARLYNEEGFDIGVIEGYHRIYALKENGVYTLIQLDDGTTAYVESRTLMDVPNINNGQYIQIIDLKQKVINQLSYIYDGNGRYLGYKKEGTICTAIASNGTYTLVTFEDGTEGFIESRCLYNSLNRVEQYCYISSDTPIFSDSELTQQIGFYNKNGIVFVSSMDEKTACIGDTETGISYYIDAKRIQLLDKYSTIGTFAYIPKDTMLYSDNDLTQPISLINQFSLLYVPFANGKTAQVINFDNGNVGFVDTSLLQAIDVDFIDIDLGDQNMDCYMGGYVAASYPTRSGKDSTPTHEGAYDIDWKATNWEFTTYRGSYANYWIPYNEYGEGIHDLIGDDEANYGNEAYHDYGSHGCVRVPSEGSQFVYDHYNVGNLVLVHK